MLKRVKVVDEDDLSTEHVNVGSKIKVRDLEFNEIEFYHIVGSSEIDPLNGKISDESPIGKALLRHKVGDIVDVETPDGVTQLEVVEISK